MKKDAGRLASTQTVARRIGLATVDQMLPWDATYCRLSPGERILALVLHLLTDREPLYRSAPDPMEQPQARIGPAGLGPSGAGPKDTG